MQSAIFDQMKRGRQQPEPDFQTIKEEASFEESSPANNLGMMRQLEQMYKERSEKSESNHSAQSHP